METKHDGGAATLASPFIGQRIIVYYAPRWQKERQPFIRSFDLLPTVEKMIAASASSSQARRSKPGPQRRTGEASRLPLSLCRFDLPRGYMVQGEGESEGEDFNTHRLWYE